MANSKQGRSFVPAAATSLLACLACIIAYSSVAEAKDKWWANNNYWMSTGEKIQAPPCGDHPPFVAHFTKDCDLVLARGKDVYWSSNSSGSPVRRSGYDCYLIMNENGELDIVSLAYGDHVFPLWGTDSAQLKTGLYYAQIQTDGNLVIYLVGNNRAIWASNTVRQ